MNVPHNNHGADDVCFDPECPNEWSAEKKTYRLTQTVELSVYWSAEEIRQLARTIGYDTPESAFDDFDQYAEAVMIEYQETEMWTERVNVAGDWEHEVSIDEEEVQQ